MEKVVGIQPHPLDGSIHLSSVFFRTKSAGVYTSKPRSGRPSKLTIREKRSGHPKMSWRSTGRSRSTECPPQRIVPPNSA
ncbi:hypothetical protein TNCV_767231 [Trichonephila clavipes]|nr:hypothetical protein TNCV_767231 [Trichonephila clavipes]